MVFEVLGETSLGLIKRWNLLAATKQNDLTMCAFSNFRIVFYINKYRSPEQATSLLAGGGRGAAGAGSISMGIPPEERGSDDTSQTNDEWTLTSIGTPQESVEIGRAR